MWPRLSRKRGLGPTLQNVGVCIKAVCNHTAHHGNGIVHGRLTSNGCAVHGLSRHRTAADEDHLIVSYGVSWLVFLLAAAGKLFALSICLHAIDDCVRASCSFTQCKALD